MLIVANVPYGAALGVGMALVQLVSVAPSVIGQTAVQWSSEWGNGRDEVLGDGAGWRGGMMEVGHEGGRTDGAQLCWIQSLHIGPLGASW